jgi:uncharacterized membrane protein
MATAKLTEETRPEKHEAIELVLAKLLRIGSIVAAILLTAGILGEVALGAGWASGLITAGLIVLVSTPVMRVTVAGIVFLRERDMLFALFCLVVLVALAIGMVIGKVE